MAEKDTGGPAFPMEGRGDFKRAPGMTLRDHFAGQALAGHYAHWGERSANEIATLAYTIADAMLAERSK